MKYTFLLEECVSVRYLGNCDSNALKYLFTSFLFFTILIVEKVSGRGLWSEGK